MSITLNTKLYNWAGFLASGISLFLEKSAGVVAGFSHLSNQVELRGPKSPTKVRWKLKVPVVATETDEAFVVGQMMREAIVDVVITYDPAATPLERADVTARLQDLVLTSEFIASATDLVQASP